MGTKEFSNEKYIDMSGRISLRIFFCQIYAVCSPHIIFVLWY